jgi:hypothetical protein
VAIIIALIYQLLGPSTFAGLGILFALLPILTLVIFKSITLYEVQCTARSLSIITCSLGCLFGLSLLFFAQARSSLADSRVKLTSEVLQGIRVVKCVLNLTICQLSPFYF